jgi:hypothetical protein
MQSPAILLAALLAADTPGAPMPSLVPASDPHVAVMGRFDRPSPGQVRLGYPGVTLRLRFEGPSLATRVGAETANSHLDVLVDGLGTNDFSLATGALPEREGFVSAYVSFVRAIRSRHPDAQVFLTEGAIVNDEADPKRPPKTVLREYLG